VMQQQKRQLLQRHLPALMRLMHLRWSFLQWKRNFSARMLSRTIILQRVCTTSCPVSICCCMQNCGVERLNTQHCSLRNMELQAAECQAKIVCNYLASLCEEDSPQSAAMGCCMCSVQQASAAELLECLAAGVHRACCTDAASQSGMAQDVDTVHG
jgi:hypothetical protein